MDIRKLQKIAVAALEDIKAEDIEVIDTRKLTALFDRIIVATGNSNRQTRALVRSVHDKVKEAGGEVYGTEGEESGEWVLIDLGDVVVHVMLPAVRAYYNLEELWQAAPKRAKDGAAAAPPKPAKASRRATAAAAATPKEPAAAAPRRRGTPGKTS
ncbi:ribosome silencing factor [Sulfurisoma sediminicola]|uniref:Ribosomal silencing factor RsfS n=1 Tax=Sulfurisoma sediminicola TaxID=1381557 RepID=A0A497XLX5_9PROT|nr:ribosome silencing factor [Sulfurisoma sediminicola]RLJ68305.1 ribosome-associated protein [Sulfurisoma sediminicola]